MAVDKDNIVESEFRLDIDQFKGAMKEVIQEFEEVKKEGKKINDEMSKNSTESAKKTGNLFKTIFEGWQKFSFNAFIFQMMVKQITGFISSLTQLAKKADEAKLAMVGLKSVSEAMGEDGGAAQKAAKEIVKLSGGLVNLQQAGQGLKFLISSGYSVQEAFKLSESMLEIGAFNNVVGNLGQAYTDATKGIKTGSVELTENIGLTQRLSSVMKQANISIENGIDITNNANQRQALYNSVLKQSEGFVGNLKQVQNEYTGAIAKSQLEITNFIVNLGKMVQPIIKVGAIIVENLVKPFNKMFNFEGKTPVQDIYNLTKEMESLQKISKPTAEEQEKLKNVMNELAKLSPSIVTSYDNMGNAQINMASATKVIIEMKKQEVLQNKKLMEQDQKLTEQQIKNIQKRIDSYDTYVAMGQAGIETTSAEFARFQMLVSKSLNGKAIGKLSLEEMLNYAKKTNYVFTNSIGETVKLTEALGTAVGIKENYLAKLRQEKSLLEDTKRTQASVLLGYKDFLKLNPEQIFAELEKARTNTKLQTDKKPEEDKYDAIGASKDFFREAEKEYLRNKLEYENRKVLLDKEYENKNKDEVYKNSLAIIEANQKANNLIYSEAQKTRDKILGAKKAQDKQDLVGIFDKTKIEIEAKKDKTEELLELETKLFEEEQKLIKQEEEKIKSLNEKAQKDKVKAEEDIIEAQLEFMNEGKKEKTNLEIELAKEMADLKIKIAQEEIKLNEEIIKAETSQQKEALQNAFEQKMNLFKQQSGQESVERQNALNDKIRQEKLAKEEMDKARQEIQNSEIGEIQLRKTNFDEYKNLSEEQKAQLQKELDEKNDYAAKNIDWKNIVLNTEEGFTNTKDELIRRLYEGEKVGWADMREMLKENLRESLIIEGQKLAGASISETVQGLIALASPVPVIKATAKDHFAAAGAAAAGALALGAIARVVVPASISGTSSSSSSSGTSTSTTGTGTDTTKTEEQKEIHIHNTGLQQIAISLIPEFESLARDGYTKIVVEGGN
jgi:hypothetical protein